MLTVVIDMNIVAVGVAVVAIVVVIVAVFTAFYLVVRLFGLAFSLPYFPCGNFNLKQGK